LASKLELEFNPPRRTNDSNCVISATGDPALTAGQPSCTTAPPAFGVFFVPGEKGTGSPTVLWGSGVWRSMEGISIPHRSEDKLVYSKAS
jgi:hypothetical protein